jgi:sulfite reductase beta subunit-like hemoprotein
LLTKHHHHHQGRIKDADGVNVKTALSRIVNELDLTMILSPTQSVVFKDIMPEQRARVDTILKECGIKPIDEVLLLKRNVFDSQFG